MLPAKKGIRYRCHNEGSKIPAESLTWQHILRKDRNPNQCLLLEGSWRLAIFDLVFLHRKIWLLPQNEAKTAELHLPTLWILFNMSSLSNSWFCMYHLKSAAISTRAILWHNGSQPDSRICTLHLQLFMHWSKSHASKNSNAELCHSKTKKLHDHLEKYKMRSRKKYGCAVSLAQLRKHCTSQRSISMYLTW